MESVEDRQWQCDPQNECPRGKAVHSELNGRGLEFLHFKRVHNPESEIADEQESDELTAGLLLSVPLSADHVRDEESLQCDLGKWRGVSERTEWVTGESTCTMVSTLVTSTKTCCVECSCMAPAITPNRQ